MVKNSTSIKINNIPSLNKSFPFLLLLCLLCNATALFSDILGPDATLYASISKYIVLNNDWINLYGNGSDWLDKPHLPFWLAACSFKVFGINAFAYKLPNFLAYILACYYVFKIGKEYFSLNIAKMATLIFASSLHIILCNFDVRAEIFLTAFILASTNHFFKSLNQSINKDLILSALFAALAILTKGVFVLITISSGFIIFWIKNQDWKQFVNPKWYLILVLILLFITPELYCLYSQFDLHPEKIIFNKTGVSGLKFFFWDSQFGRFFNNGPITGESEKLFFVHTTIWAYLPWSFALVTAIFFRIYNPKKYEKNVTNDFLYILNASALITFLMFNFSQFQLPHYIVIIFPHLSIFISNYLNWKPSIKQINWLNILLFITVILIAALTSSMSFLFNMNFSWITLLVSCLTILFFMIFWKTKTQDYFIIKGALLMCMFAIFLNIIYFPSLMKYQSGMNAGKFQNKYYPNQSISMFQCNDYNFEFYGNTKMNRVEELKDILLKKEDSTIIFGNKINILKINNDSFSIKPIKAFAEFHISEMKLDFAKENTRKNVIDSFYIATCVRLK